MRDILREKKKYYATKKPKYNSFIYWFYDAKQRFFFHSL